MIDKDSVAVVIPAYNEEKHIVSVLHSLHDAGYRRCIVVNDGSHDSTAERARPYATVLTHAIGRGYGAALTTGTLYALQGDADYIVHFDGDGQFKATEVDAIIEPLIRNRADITFGSRYLDKKSSAPKSKEWLIHKPALFVQTLTTGLTFSDIHNGFRGLTRSAAEQLETRQDRMAYSSEIVNEVKRLGLRYVEVPVTIAYQEYGQGFIGGLRIYKDLIVKTLFRQ